MVSTTAWNVCSRPGSMFVGDIAHSQARRSSRVACRLFVLIWLLRWKRHSGSSTQETVPARGIRIAPRFDMLLASWGIYWKVEDWEFYRRKEFVGGIFVWSERALGLETNERQSVLLFYWLVSQDLCSKLVKCLKDQFLESKLHMVLQ